MSLYVVTVPVTVETYADSPGEALAQAGRAIDADHRVAVMSYVQEGKARIRLWPVPFCGGLPLVRWR